MPRIISFRELPSAASYGFSIIFFSIFFTLSLNKALNIDYFDDIYTQISKVFPFTYAYFASAIILGRVISSGSKIFSGLIKQATDAIVHAWIFIASSTLIVAILIANEFKIVWPTPIAINEALFTTIVFCAYLSKHLYRLIDRVLAVTITITAYIVITQAYKGLSDEFANLSITIFLTLFLSHIKVRN